MRPRQAVQAARSARRWKQATALALVIGILACVAAPTGSPVSEAGAVLTFAACIAVVAGLVRWINTVGQS